jgi:hypothetical protein
VTAEELKANKESVTFQFCANHLDNKDVFGKSDPYFILSKLVGNGKYEVVKKSEVVMNDLNPSWNEFTIPVRDLCNNDYDRNEWTSHQMEKGTFFGKNKIVVFFLLHTIVHLSMVRMLKFEVYDCDSYKDSDPIGGVTTTLGALVEAAKGGADNKFALINPKKMENKKNYKDSGTEFTYTAYITYALLSYHDSGIDKYNAIHIVKGCLSGASIF